MTHFRSGRARPVFFAALLLCAAGTLFPAHWAQADPSASETKAAKTTSLEKITLKLASQTIEVEVADNEQSRSRGLMYRHSMAADDGMLFVFEYPHQPCFWMKNTYLPLSIAFITAQGSISSMHDMQPKSTDTHCPSEPILYALEMNQGWFEKNGLRIGDKIKGLP